MPKADTIGPTIFPVSAAKTGIGGFAHPESRPDADSGLAAEPVGVVRAGKREDHLRKDICSGDETEAYSRGSIKVAQQSVLTHT